MNLLELHIKNLIIKCYGEYIILTWVHIDELSLGFFMKFNRVIFQFNIQVNNYRIS